MSCLQNIVFVISYTFSLFSLPKYCLFVIETKKTKHGFSKRHGQFRPMIAELEPQAGQPQSSLIFPAKNKRCFNANDFSKNVYYTTKHPIILLHAVKFRWIVKWENKMQNFWRVFYPLIFFINSRVYTFYLTTVWLFNIVLSTPFSLF